MILKLIKLISLIISLTHWSEATSDVSSHALTHTLFKHNTSLSTEKAAGERMCVVAPKWAYNYGYAICAARIKHYIPSTSRLDSAVSL
jgi:hypothetical protein